MASTVLTGASAGTAAKDGVISTPSTLFTNNTGQNVRIVINYMTSLSIKAPSFAGSITSGPLTGWEYGMMVTLSWAGVTETIAIPTDYNRYSQVGANLKFVFGRNIATFNGSSNPGNSNDNGGATSSNAGLISYPAAGNLSDPGSDAYRFPSVPGNVNQKNSRFVDNLVFALPTEIMLAPNQSFSAICGIYNIVVIPENG